MIAVLIRRHHGRRSCGKGEISEHHIHLAQRRLLRLPHRHWGHMRRDAAHAPGRDRGGGERRDPCSRDHTRRGPGRGSGLDRRREANRRGVLAERSHHVLEDGGCLARNLDVRERRSGRGRARERAKQDGRRALAHGSREDRWLWRALPIAKGRVAEVRRALLALGHVAHVPLLGLAAPAAPVREADPIEPSLLLLLSLLFLRREATRWHPRRAGGRNRRN